MVVKASTKPWPRQLGSSILRALPPLVKPGRVKLSQVCHLRSTRGPPEGAHQEYVCSSSLGRLEIRAHASWRTHLACSGVGPLEPAHHRRARFLRRGPVFGLFAPRSPPSSRWLVALVADLLPPSRDARLGRPIATDGNGMTRPGALTSEHSLGKRQGRMPVGRIGISSHPWERSPSDGDGGLGPLIGPLPGGG